MKHLIPSIDIPYPGFGAKQVKRTYWYILFLFATVIVVPALSQADKMDVALARLKVAAEDGSDVCPRVLSRDENGEPDSVRQFCADNEAWTQLMSQLAMAAAPSLLTPADTVGYGGLYIGLQSSTTSIDSSATYWARGTEGAGEGDLNSSVSSTLSTLKLNIRKGLPMGFELGASFGWLPTTTVLLWGADFKWSVFEGFRRNWTQYLPDLAFYGSVHVTSGDDEFVLVVPTGGFVLSKPITIASSMTLTPFFGGEVVGIIAESDLIDLTPERDAFEECGQDPRPPQVGDEGNVLCTRDANDFNNNVVFDSISGFRGRFALGLRGEFQKLSMAASFMMDAFSANKFSSAFPAQRQWTVSVSAGAKL